MIDILDCTIAGTWRIGMGPRCRHACPPGQARGIMTLGSAGVAGTEHDDRCGTDHVARGQHGRRGGAVVQLHFRRGRSGEPDGISHVIHET